MWNISSQNRIEVSASYFLKGKEAQTLSNKAFGSSKTNTRHIPMLDIIRPALTVGMTTVSAPIGRREAFFNSNWLFFLQLKLELYVCSVRMLYACVASRRLRHVDVSTFGRRMYYWIPLSVPIRTSYSNVDLWLFISSAQSYFRSRINDISRYSF